MQDPAAAVAWCIKFALTSYHIMYTGSAGNHLAEIQVHCKFQCMCHLLVVGAKHPHESRQIQGRGKAILPCS